MASKKVVKGKGTAQQTKEKQLAVKLVKLGKLTYREIHQGLKAQIPGFNKSVSWVKNVGFELRNGGRKAIGVWGQRTTRNQSSVSRVVKKRARGGPRA